MTSAAEILIALVPVLLLFAALLAGRYPGEISSIVPATDGLTSKS